jgi:probable rRNA maturation factor
MTGDEEPGKGQALELALLNPLRYGLLGLRSVRPWLDLVIRDIAPDALSFGVLFTSDQGIANLNRRYRGRKGPTDVLSFPGDGDGHLGDVAISVPTARRQAQNEGHDLEQEIRLLLLHGILHCLGYDHEKDDGAMKKLELELHERHLEQE